MTLFVGTEDGLFAIRHGGGDPTVQLPGHAVGCLASDGERWWALGDGQAVWRSDGPGSWEMAAPAGDRRVNCLCPTTAGLLVGTAEARLATLNEGRLDPIGAFDEVAGRDDWYTPWGGPPDVRSISADPDGRIYVNVHVGGVVRSTDAGSTWQPTIAMDTDVHQVLAVTGRPRWVVAALGDAGVALSRDGGDEWERVIEGLHATYCRAVAAGERILLVSASDGPRGGRAAVYRRPIDSGGALERCSDGLPEWFPGNIDTFCLAAAGSSAALGTEDGDVFVSDDEGSTWRAAASALPSVRCLAWG